MTSQTLKDLLAAGRVANLPSVASNVVLGVGLGILCRMRELSEIEFVLPVLVACFLYLGGCFLNDWKDHDWDREHRKERAIPAGRIPRASLGLLAILFLLAGVALSVLLPSGAFLSALAVTGFILLYTYFHKATTWSILLMGAARGGLYCLGFFSQPWHFEGSSPIGWSAAALDHAPDHLWPLFPKVLGLVFYIAGLSLWARAESKPVLNQRHRCYGIMLILFAGVTHIYDWDHEFWPHQIGALLPFLLLIAVVIRVVKSSIPRAVSLLLAGICLLDLVAAWPLAITLATLSMPAEVAVIFPIVSGVAFLTALLLQKLAPAT